MSSKHPKLKKPTNVDLKRNPLIGGSKGVVMAQATPDDLAEIEGVNTFEGDIDNDTNAQGGIEDLEQHGRGSQRSRDRDSGSRRPALQGKKTHEQQLRMLERKPDIPDERQFGQEVSQAEQRTARRPRQQARQSEFPVSRGGMNQESQHNKHNHQTQAGHRPPKPRTGGG